MTWATYWFVIYIVELLLWAYVIYLHFIIKMLQKPKSKFYKQTKVVVRTKRDIVRG